MASDEPLLLEQKQGTHREEDHLEVMDLENDKKKSKLQINFLEESFVIYCLCCETIVSCSQESPGQVIHCSLGQHKTRRYASRHQLTSISER